MASMVCCASRPGYARRQAAVSNSVALSGTKSESVGEEVGVANDNHQPMK